jgi:hypothetical protein
MSRERPLLSDRAIQIVAENRIRAAMDAGEFDNLPGFGRPSALIDEPYDPHWWIRRKLRNEKLTPAQIGARALGWTAGTTDNDIIEHYKRSVDREKLRANLQLSVEERFKNRQQMAQSHENNQ